MFHASCDYVLFCDASVSSKEKQALGAYLILQEEEAAKTYSTNSISLQKFVEKSINYYRFATRKSTEAELKTFLQALSKIPISSKVSVFTDCQSLCDLLGARRLKLERKNFKNSRGEELAHKDLYQAIFTLVDQYQVEVHKVKGHVPSRERRTKEEEIFSYVDRFSRSRLREVL